MQLRIKERLDAVAVTEPGAPPKRLDWVFTAFLALVAVLIIATNDALLLRAEFIPAFAAVAFIPFRRVIPLIAVATVAVIEVVVLGVALRDLSIDETGLSAGLAGIVLLYALCRWAAPRDIVIGFAVSMSSATFVEWAADDLTAEDWLIVVPWMVVAGFSLAMRYRASLVVTRNTQIRLTERNSLARELHDTVAHHVSAIAVQAQAGQYVASTNPQAAVEALRAIEKIANESIDEMRRMVGILRSDDDQARTVAADSLESLADPGGRPAVHLVGNIRLDDLPAGVGAALFRIAQESITNGRRHSRDASFVEVVVTRHDDHVEMVVDNDGTPTTRNSGSGYGQVGMQERVDALGGSFESGPRPGAGWRTATSIPFGRVDP
ncbi:MAG: signal transduction histidine kinase [Ilumatobacter sp.]